MTRTIPDREILNQKIDPYNLFKLRQEYFCDVTRALKVIRHISDESAAEREAEAYIVSIFLEAGMTVTDDHRKASFRSLNLLWLSVALLTVVPWPYKVIDEIFMGLTALGTCIISFVNLSDRTNLCMQLKLENGYYPVPSAMGDENVYATAQDRIEKLILKSGITRDHSPSP